MNYDFDHVMAQKTDEELIAIVTTDRHKFEPEAIESANREISRRNIGPEDFAKLSANALQQAKQLSDGANATTAQRFVHTLIDSFAFLIVLIFIATFYTALVPLSNTVADALLVWLMVLSVYIIYFWLMEYKTGKTLGKFITKTHVVKMDGSEPSGKDILIRTLCRFIPFDNVSFLFMKNGFHDGISNTKVISD